MKKGDLVKLKEKYNGRFLFFRGKKFEIIDIFEIGRDKVLSLKDIDNYDSVIDSLQKYFERID